MERVLRKLEDLVYNQLDDLSKKNDISPAEIENAKNAICLLLKMDELKGGVPEEMEYSNRYSNARGMRAYYSNGYGEGMQITPMRSYTYPERIRMGASYNDGYSRHSIKDRAIDKLERMMDEAQSESERETIRKMIVGLEHMELY